MGPFLWRALQLSPWKGAIRWDAEAKAYRNRDGAIMLRCRRCLGIGYLWGIDRQRRDCETCGGRGSYPGKATP